MHDAFLKDCQELIRRPSESGHEEAVATYIKGVMERFGYDKVWIDELGSVVGVIDGGGSRTVLLQGHMDTVGVVDKTAWRFDPYAATVDDGRIYGRGASDMKCALMAMVYGAGALAAHDRRPPGTIAVAGVVCEEEFEGVAQGHVLDQVKPDIVIIGEASELKLNIGQRGRAEIVVKTFGKSAHSSNPSAGINAVKKMYPLLAALEEMPLPRDPFLGSAVMELTDIHSEPYPGASVIPALCRVTLDRRLLPGETEASVLAPIRDIIAALQEKDADFSAEVSLASAEKESYTGRTISATRFFPAWQFPHDAPFVIKAKAALVAAGLSGDLSHYKFCTDGSQSAGVRGIPTMGFGPSSESLAHVKDEYVSIAQLEKARKGYTSLIDALLESV